MTTTKALMIERASPEVPLSGILVSSCRDEHFVPSDDRAPQFGDRTWTTDLVRLLSSAGEALANDRARTGQLIARAATLVRAEVERDKVKERTLTAPANTRLAPWQARRALDFIEMNLVHAIRVKELSAVARLSPSYFSRAFRADFGEPPYAYIVRRRVYRAQEMMRRTDKPLAFIAVACGLADQSHLTRLFRRIVGISPASWRRLNRVAVE